MAGLVRRARQVENSRLVRFLGVAGWSAYGLVHLVIAGLALQIALGDRAEHAAPQGRSASSPRSRWARWCWWSWRWGCSGSPCRSSAWR
ncbi:hypothetical protein ACFQ0O_20605 [Saccharopolyspora spinosporotrichia]